MKILVSACLLGENCKYNGGDTISLKSLKTKKEPPMRIEILIGGVNV